MTRRGRSRGSSTAEYLGVVGAVALLMLALLAVREHRPERRPPVDPVAHSPICCVRPGRPGPGRPSLLVPARRGPVARGRPRRRDRRCSCRDGRSGGDWRGDAGGARLGPVRTLGIDLSAQAKRTATCAIDWSDGRASVGVPHVGADDEALLAAMREADWIGIDAPFGWPDAMVRAVGDHAEGRPWPEPASSPRLRYRTTDWFVQGTTDANGTSVWPLSVSSDRIAVCAWRCASLLSRHSTAIGRRIDRSGADPAPRGAVVEVYPAAALAMWGLPYGDTRRRAMRRRAPRTYAWRSSRGSLRPPARG